MASILTITSPHDGDVLNRHDGFETGGALTVTVQGSCPAGERVSVNGRPAQVHETNFQCEISLTHRETVLTAETETQRTSITVYWNRNSRKRFRFSVDDNIEFLKDLALHSTNYPSLFDHAYLRFWREMHREFGAKIHLNLYYQTDGFDLVQMPDRWRDEWQANASWLHLSFHALQDKPDRPYRHAQYAQIAHDHDLVCGHIRRFAGNEVLSNTTTLHWAECPKSAIAALRDRGIENMVALFSVQGYQGACTTGYYLPENQCSYCDTRNAWHDRDTGITFIRCTAVINTLELEDIPRVLEERTTSPHTQDMLELLIHEQYFRKELSYYQPAILEKVRTAIQWAVDHEYVPVFWSDGFLGT